MHTYLQRLNAVVCYALVVAGIMAAAMVGSVALRSVEPAVTLSHHQTLRLMNNKVRSARLT